ncbi:hypothetical protein ACP70R_024757 [Stipagrostis hirtigluma subsp. patula]
MAAEAMGFMARAADGARAAELVTRDFLGGCAAADDARDAAARHDAVPGKPMSVQKHACPPTPRDLNLFPVAAAATKQQHCPAAAAAAPDASTAGATTTYHSVCTIEKVKTALERFERGKHHHHQHHPQQHSGASPSSSSVTTSSVKRRGGGGGGGGGSVEQGDGCDSPSGGGGGGGGMVAAACPRCFLYVLISRSDPRCPRCESHVPTPAPPAAHKKPRIIDLNVGFSGT